MDVMDIVKEVIVVGILLDLELFFNGEVVFVMFVIMFVGEFVCSGVKNYFELDYNVFVIGDFVVII